MDIQSNNLPVSDEKVLLTTIEEILVFNNEIQLNKPINCKTIASITIGMIDIKRQRENRVNRINKLREKLIVLSENFNMIGSMFLNKLDTMEEYLADNYKKQYLMLENKLNTMREYDLLYIGWYVMVFIGIILSIYSFYDTIKR